MNPQYLLQTSQILILVAFHSANVQGLIKRCGGAFVNPFGDPSQYRPERGSATLTATQTGDVARATNIYDGTTYFGGQTGVASGTTRIVSAVAVVEGTTILPSTTTWISNTPGIISGTSATGGAAMTGRPVIGPTPSETSLPVFQSYHISGGAVAGIVLGLVASAIIAHLLVVCWHRKRTEHIPPSGKIHIPHRPTQTVVAEKIEPVVVRTVPANQTNYPGSIPATRPSTEAANLV
ncbi:hypothetical protein EDD21DRAFT_352926 [Dissophora ornata]|nr:hypothetical protein EDD21DRAFT_352926 [Dissophora ornata]